MLNQPAVVASGIVVEVVEVEVVEVVVEVVVDDVGWLIDTAGEGSDTARVRPDPASASGLGAPNWRS